jgi:hypothetical protein
MARSKPPKPPSPAKAPLEPPRFREHVVVPLSSLSKDEQERIIREATKPLSVALKDQAENFYFRVGQGISHWSRMEGCLIQIASKLLRAPENKVGLVMYSIININIWLQIIDDMFVLDRTYPKSLRTWRRISEVIRSQNAVRVRLAHHSISQEEINVEGELTGFQAYLRPGQFDTRVQSQKFKPLTVLEIIDFILKVNDIHDNLISLLALMRKRKSFR